jgi:hypothetical protein
MSQEAELDRAASVGITTYAVLCEMIVPGMCVEDGP